MNPSQFYDHDPRHFRFTRQFYRRPVIEEHAHVEGVLWAICLVTAILSALVVWL